ncbi:MAG TPA: tRNA pseudouridine(38-40) synthase TruA [Candidatus Flavonifractor merdipullorum]|uniref:tRNA pseudouridine synthase A n=1 Tax=Candidatus Flavonifractor merdipullorum TaxID=2838590 RepID=A0A9D1RTR2_9FIRM|nr:tRNA pseudouridine(38-40) synthase TruA [Candidatus Flavonifractor merdipullorum]
MRRNIALQLMYVGTAYHGWQVQKTIATVAETLEKALSTVVCHPVKCTGAGRTDAGVHAEAYIANFYTDSAIPADRIPLAVNTRLPDDIVVISGWDVPQDFNAIGSCIKKEYTYRIYNSRIRNAFFVDRAWFYPKPLDAEVMNRAASHFVGTHDFAAVRSVGTDVRSTVRTVHYFDISRQGDVITCRVCADGFLYNMVRAMVGTCVYASEGKFGPDDIPAILDGKCRTAAGPTVPPGGLYMTRLWYPEDTLGEIVPLLSPF